MSRSAKAVLEANSKSFAFAAHFLGREEAQSATRLYAFCRYIDDLADTPGRSAFGRRRLKMIGRDLLAGTTDDPVVRDFLDLSRTCGIDAQAPIDLINGVRGDIGDVLVEDRDALLDYAYAVAGTVGVMMCGVFGVTNPNARRHAADLGIAMQLTNIARDVGEDAHMGRRYLPAAWVNGAAPECIASPGPDLQRTLKHSVRRLLILADTYYASGLGGLGYLPPRPRLTILIAAKLYQRIGDRIKRIGYRTWDQRASVPIWQKILIASQQTVRFLLVQSLRRPPTTNSV